MSTLFHILRTARRGLPGLLLLILTGVGLAQLAPAPIFDLLPSAPAATTLVPDPFIRRWDPITIFFSKPVGPKTPGPEDHPEQWVELSPAHPGGWRWLNARTLQLRPARPWPPLSRTLVKVDGKTFQLDSLMEAPRALDPPAQAEGLTSVKRLRLTFDDPIEPAELATMLSLELRPLPGVESQGGRVLRPEEYEIKALERPSADAPAILVVELEREVPPASRLVGRIKRSRDASRAESMFEWSFSTAGPFRVASLGCRELRLPIPPEGAHFGRDQALKCTSTPRTLMLELTAAPAELPPPLARSLIRLEPPVERLEFQTVDRRVEVTGSFQPGVLYKISLTGVPARDSRGRLLEAPGPSSLYLYFEPQASYVRTQTGNAVLERLGPQLLPLEGRGETAVDLRIHAIDPLERSFWPFPDSPVTVDEGSPPALPGEEPQKLSDAGAIPDEYSLQGHLRALAAPLVSTRANLPLRREGGGGRFGLDLGPFLSAAVGAGRPGTYLVGVQRYGATQRAWSRVQITDLALTLVEEPARVQAFVTSLSSGKALAGAQVQVEAAQSVDGGSTYVFKTLASGTTDREGRWTWAVPGPLAETFIRRLSVRLGDDLLVLDPNHPRQVYRDGYFSADYQPWLAWTVSELTWRTPRPETLVHLFSERPVYRPEEEVHLKGYLRTLHQGVYSLPQGPFTLVVTGPGELQWRYPITLSAQGSFYQRFKEEAVPTGAYYAYVEDSEGTQLGFLQFLLDAYRIPTFELGLNGPDQVPMDRPFQVGAVASYYAGGRLSGAPIRWRVTQMPLTWSPPGGTGYFFSSDGRYSTRQRFEASPALSREDVTGEDGAASLSLDPALEATAQPRQYSIEATVTGADDQTVTSTRTVKALPPFVLGVKLPRMVESVSGGGRASSGGAASPRASSPPGPGMKADVTPEVVVLSPEGVALEGQAVQARLILRQWHSILQSGDFSAGAARYLTDVVDETVLEQSLVSVRGGTPLPIALPRPGVYVLELTAQDRLGRAQTVSVDFFAGGSGSVTWQKPEAGVFTLSPDKTEYAPGETARLVVQSPYQSAAALVVTERAEGIEVRRAEVKGGVATLSVPIQPTDTPRIPVHVVLLRGRLPASGPLPGTTFDPGRPDTAASTVWLPVRPDAQRIQLTLSHPDKATPGSSLPLTLQLKDGQGKPVSGEVTLWLVDQAVLSLGRERRLDPVPDFVRERPSLVAVRDTRGDVVGWIPFSEMPGGDGALEDSDLLEKTTVRKNFKTVPYYNPSILVGKDGTARVSIALPDNLTVFQIRAKASAGLSRFGFARSKVAVRLPVLVQPALPRFVRSGDRFTGVALARVVEGAGGDGKVQIALDGLMPSLPLPKTLKLAAKEATRLAFPLEAPELTWKADGSPARTEVGVTVGVSRAADGVSDAFEVRLPLLPDRRSVHQDQLLMLSGSDPLLLPALREGARAGTLKRTLTFSDQPVLLQMLAGLDYVREFPHGCTEQQLARARVYLGLSTLQQLLGARVSRAELEAAVAAVLERLSKVTDARGRVAFWPGSSGSVTLTAWTLEFLMEARDAGFQITDAQVDALVRPLTQALRSDAGGFIDGDSWLERAWALSALARARRFDAAYGSELLRQAQFLDQEGLARVLGAFLQSGETATPAVQTLQEKLWDGLSFQLKEGKEIFAGLVDRGRRSPLLLPGEVRTLSEVARTLFKLEPQSPRLGLVYDALIARGEGQGWGSTNANAAAMLALGERLKPRGETSASSMPPVVLELKLGAQTEQVTLGPQTPVVQVMQQQAEGGEVRRASGDQRPVALRLESRYLPSPSGALEPAAAQGFVVARTLARVPATGGPLQKLPLDQPGQSLTFAAGEVVEDQVQVINPELRHYVAIEVPLAAGLEPLNPALATAPPEASPSRGPTLQPAYALFRDDRVVFYYDQLPQGTFELSFRARATVEGQFQQPSASASMMYREAVYGSSPGARVIVEKR